MNPAFIVQLLIRFLSLLLMIKGVMTLFVFTTSPNLTDFPKVSSNMIYWMYEFNFVMPFLAGILLWGFSMQISDTIIGIVKYFTKS